MNAIQHEQIRFYLHMGREVLELSARDALDGHLAECAICREYAAAFAGTQANLARAMHTRWDQTRPVTSLDEQIQNRLGRRHMQKQILHWSSNLASAGLLLLLVVAINGLFQNAHPNASTSGSGIAGIATSTPLPHPLNRTFGDQIVLRGYSLLKICTNKTIQIKLFWQAQATSRADYSAFIRVLDAQGLVIAQSDGMLMSNSRPTSQWRSGESTVDERSIDYPPTLGLVTLQVGVYRQDTGERLLADQNEDTVTLTRLVSGAQCVNQSFSNNITLIGQQVNTDFSAPPESIQVTLFWQAQTFLPTSYTMFLHVVDAQGNLVVQQESIPANGTLPTNTWAVDDLVQDHYALALPAGLPPGQYQVVVGMYDATTGARVNMGQGSNAITLATVELK